MPFKSITIVYICSIDSYFVLKKNSTFVCHKISSFIPRLTDDLLIVRWPPSYFCWRFCRVLINEKFLSWRIRSQAKCNMEDVTAPPSSTTLSVSRHPKFCDHAAPYQQGGWVGDFAQSRGWPTSRHEWMLRCRWALLVIQQMPAAIFVEMLCKIEMRLKLVSDVTTKWVKEDPPNHRKSRRISFLCAWWQRVRCSNRYAAEEPGNWIREDCSIFMLSNVTSRSMTQIFFRRA